MVPDEVFVGIPVGADLLGPRVLGAAVDLHEPYTPFDEAAGEQTLPSKGADVGMIEPVELFHDV